MEGRTSFLPVARAKAPSDQGRLSPTIKNSKQRSSLQSVFSKIVTRSHQHSLSLNEKILKVTRRVVAPYAEIQRLDPNREVRVRTTVEFERLTKDFLVHSAEVKQSLWETGLVLKTVTKSSGFFVFLVKEATKELVLMPHYILNSQRQQINIPIEEGRCMAAAAAAARQWLRARDVRRERRWADGVRWAAARAALAVPVLTPAGDCYAVMQLYNTDDREFDDVTVHTVLEVCRWAGAAAGRARARDAGRAQAALAAELLAVISTRCCTDAEIDDVVGELLPIIRSYMRVQRASLLTTEADAATGQPTADSWTLAGDELSRRRFKLLLERSPAAAVYQSGECLNVRDAYRDRRFAAELHPDGTYASALLVQPIRHRGGVIGIVQVVNKLDGSSFDAGDEALFSVVAEHCSLVMHHYHVRDKAVRSDNVLRLQSEIMSVHMRACDRDLRDLADKNDLCRAPPDFYSIAYHPIGVDDIPQLTCFMLVDLLGDHVTRSHLEDFVLTCYSCHQDLPYHNAKLGFCFTHALYLVLREKGNGFSLAETFGLLLAGLCHGMEHPGRSAGALARCGHPLHKMYRTAGHQKHALKLGTTLIEQKMVLSKLPPKLRDQVLKEFQFSVLSTDFSVHMQIRGRVGQLLDEGVFCMDVLEHRKYAKAILLASCGYAVFCKPFEYVEKMAQCLKEEQLIESETDRSLGYTPLGGDSARAQRARLATSAEPCLGLLTRMFRGTGAWLENCRETMLRWDEDLASRGKRLWRQELSLPADAVNGPVYKLEPSPSDSRT